MSANEVYYHFTKTKNLESVFKSGLEPRIGENAQNVENKDSFKVFFSKGKEGVLKCIDVWIRWYIVKYQRIKYANDFTKGMEKSPATDSEFSMRIKEAIDAHNLDVRKDMRLAKEEKKIETEESKMAAFKQMYKDWKNLTYLQLDIKEGEDFSSSDIDEVKQRQCQTVEGKEYLEYMYGPIDNPEGLEYWNMHTFKDHGVSPEKISLVKENQNGLDFVLEVYDEVYKEKQDEELYLLNEFISLVKLKKAGQNIETDANPKDYLENPGYFSFLI